MILEIDFRIRRAVLHAAILVLSSTICPGESAFLIDHTGPSATHGGTVEGTKGWWFSLDSDISISHLGIFDGGGDGLAASHQVGLWLGTDPFVGNPSGTLLASAT